ncbi:hypothetical protein TIFTF001_032860 [Ficus carica]|uniref:S-protein homolog n=1 Tax=Ficus carica TaxID=3494 RepID=A0AA88DXT1_FICCA|nr:hypothetical protein TIFTF001_032860 [Ficus carica]
MTTTNNIVGLFNFSLLLLLAFFIARPTSSFASLLTKYHVHVINDMPEMGANILFVQCKSGDDDKGARELRLGEEYGWGTRVNAVGTTLFFCLLKWEDVKARYFEALETKAVARR